MKSAFLVLALSGLILIGCVTSSSSQNEPSDAAGEAKRLAKLQAEVEETCDRWRAAMASGDRKKVASYYADNAVILSSDGVRVEGREAIDQYWKQIPEVLRWDLFTHSVEGVDDFLVQRGQSVILVKTPNREIEFDVQFAHIWRRQADGSLRIIVDSYWAEP